MATIRKTENILNFKGKKVHVTEIIKSVQAGAFIEMFTLFSQINFLPLNYQVMAIDLALANFRQPFPRRDDLLDGSPSHPARLTIVKTTCALKYLRGDSPRMLLSSDTSGKIRIQFEQAWPQILKWIRFLLTIHSASTGETDPSRSTQDIIGSVCAFLCDMNEQEFISRRIMEDPVTFAIVLSAYLKHDPHLLITMDSENKSSSAASDAPAHILSQILQYRTKHANLKDSLRILDGQERTIIRLALKHLRRAPNMSLATSAPFRKARTNIFLLDMLTHVDSFIPYLVKNKIIVATVSALELVVAHIPSPSENTDPLLLPSGIVACLKLLFFFVSRTRADLCIRVMLAEHVEASLSTIANLIPSNPRDDSPETRYANLSKLILAQFASYVVSHNAVNSVALATERAFMENPVLGKSKQVGEMWSLLQLERYAIERAICRYIFDEASVRIGIKCSGCGNRILREMVKKCSVCRTATYCSRSCQRLGWNAHHKAECGGIRQRKDKLDATTGKHDAHFQLMLAKNDLMRFLPSVYDHIRRRNPSLSIHDVRIGLIYVLGPEAPYPIISVTYISKDAANEIAYHLNNFAPGTNSDNSNIQIVLTDVVVALGDESSSTMMPIPVNRKWLEVAYDPNHIMRTRKPHFVSDKRFRRAEFRMEERVPGREEVMLPLEALRDDIDDIMLELGRVTMAHPDWSFWRRVRHAVQFVEDAVRKYNRNLYDDWA